jgi:hypothetical protein
MLKLVEHMYVRHGEIRFQINAETYFELSPNQMEGIDWMTTKPSLLPLLPVDRQPCADYMHA